MNEVFIIKVKNGYVMRDCPDEKATINDSWVYESFDSLLVGISETFGEDYPKANPFNANEPIK